MSTAEQSILDAALETLALNIYPLPILKGTKKPPMKEWQRVRLTLDDLPEYFGNGHDNQLGWVLGIEPRPICDVDVDCQEARAVAQLVAGPKTNRVLGRPSAPTSHYFFELPEEFASEKFEDLVAKKEKKSKPMLIELRGRGGQTVVAPSIHESGESRRWERNGEFGITTLVELRPWVAKIAAAALLVRYWPGGHETRQALAGMLARAGWAKEEAIEFVTAVVKIAQPENREARADVRNCYERQERGEEIFGRSKLEELLGDHGKLILRAVSKWLSLKSASSVSVVDNEGLIRNGEGVIKPILANAITMLKTTPCWEGVLAYNELTLMPEKLRPAPWEDRPGKTPWSDHDDTKLAEWFQHQKLFIRSSREAGEAANAVARENSYHPVRRYLDALQWDGKRRLNTWLSRYLGVKDSRYVRAAGRCWMISCVARVYRPGCKVDYILTLESGQGWMKSTALHTLAGGDEFFLDDFTRIDDKDALLKMHSSWIIEMAELTGTRRDVNKVKSFVTSKDDVFRAPYDRRPQHHPRMCVFAATTNDDVWMTDETGGRRFWPVECGKIEIEKLAKDRNQLWAEAVERYGKGEKWWFQTDALNVLAIEEQRNRYQKGQWDALIEKYLDDLVVKRVTIDEIRSAVIGAQVSQWRQADMNSAARCLVHNGWKRRQIRIGDLRKWVYEPVPVDTSRNQEGGDRI